MATSSAPCPRPIPRSAKVLVDETRRQEEALELIASENFVSDAVMTPWARCSPTSTPRATRASATTAAASSSTCRNLAIDRAKALFGADHANVQPHSGAQANMAVYFAAVQPGDKVLAMDLAQGGHLTHGSAVNFSGRLYDIIPYGLGEDERIDYQRIKELADAHKPKMIIAGASAYPRVIDFQQIRKAADLAGAVVMVDMAHIAGLVAAGIHPGRCPTPSTSPPPPTRRCAAPGAGSSSAARSSRRRSTPGSSPGPRADP